MSDTRAAMREFRFLDEKRKVGGLSTAEEQRWAELRGLLGLPEAPAQDAQQPYPQQQAGYYAEDGNWYPYPANYYGGGFDPNQAWQGGWEQWGPGYGYPQYPNPAQGYDPAQYGGYDAEAWAQWNYQQQQLQHAYWQQQLQQQVPAAPPEPQTWQPPADESLDLGADLNIPALEEMPSAEPEVAAEASPLAGENESTPPLNFDAAFRPEPEPEEAAAQEAPAPSPSVEVETLAAQALPASEPAPVSQEETTALATVDLEAEAVESATVPEAEAAPASKEEVIALATMDLEPEAVESVTAPEAAPAPREDVIALATMDLEPEAVESVTAPEAAPAPQEEVIALATMDLEPEAVASVTAPEAAAAPREDVIAQGSSDLELGAAETVSEHDVMEVGADDFESVDAEDSSRHAEAATETVSVDAVADEQPVVQPETEPEPVVAAADEQPVIQPEPEPELVVAAADEQPVIQPEPEPELVVAAADEQPVIQPEPEPELVVAAADEQPVIQPEPEPELAVAVADDQPVFEPEPEPESILAAADEQPAERVVYDELPYFDTEPASDSLDVDISEDESSEDVPLDDAVAHAIAGAEPMMNVSLDHEPSIQIDPSLYGDTEASFSGVEDEISVEDLDGQPSDEVPLATAGEMASWSGDDGRAQHFVPAMDEAPAVVDSSSLAELAQEGHTASPDALDVDLSGHPEESLSLATNSDFLDRPELVNTGEQGQWAAAWDPAQAVQQAAEDAGDEAGLQAPLEASDSSVFAPPPEPAWEVTLEGSAPVEQPPAALYGYPSQAPAEWAAPVAAVADAWPPQQEDNLPEAQIEVDDDEEEIALVEELPAVEEERPPSVLRPGPGTLIGGPVVMPAPSDLPADREQLFGTDLQLAAPGEGLTPSYVDGEHRVIIHTIEGQVKRGTIRDVDLLESVIPLELQNGFAPDSIPASRIKAVFFMLPAGSRPLPNEGRKLRVTFKDGRQVAGFSTDYSGREQGFFLTPADNRTNTGRIFIYRGSVQSVLEG
jgi:hypothetical protein